MTPRQEPSNANGREVADIGNPPSKNMKEAAHKELELLGKASSWLAPLFPTREQWYRWFASFLNPEHHGHLWALTHLSICNLDQIEGMLVSLFAQEYERVGRYKRISDLPERNTDWGLTYANAVLPIPTRYHAVSLKRMPDRTVWSILLNLAHTLLRYHEQAGVHTPTSKALHKAYQKTKTRFPDIDSVVANQGDHLAVAIEGM